jgi:GNAT superfamily N-acetyltransferase
MSGFRPSDVRIFRPYPDEVPWELLAEAGFDDAELTGALEVDLLRVAKHEGRVAGVYAIRRQQALRYELLLLTVADGYRRKGLGRWLLGHALGLAETKGGREVVAGPCPAAGPSRAARPQSAAWRFLSHLGFEPHEAGLRLILTPE